MIFEILTTTALITLFVGLIVLFLYVRSLRVIMVDVSKQCDDEISSMKGKNEELVTGLNNTIKTMKVLSNKVTLEFKNLHRDLTRSEQANRRKALMIPKSIEVPERLPMRPVPPSKPSQPVVKLVAGSGIQPKP